MISWKHGSGPSFGLLGLMNSRVKCSCVSAHFDREHHATGLCPKQGLRKGFVWGYSQLPQRDCGRMGGCVAQLSKWEFSGRKRHLQHEFTVNGKCELQLQVLPQPDSPRTCEPHADLRDTLSLSITHRQFEGTKERLWAQSCIFITNLCFSQQRVRQNQCVDCRLGHLFPKVEVW